MLETATKLKLDLSSLKEAEKQLEASLDGASERSAKQIERKLSRINKEIASTQRKIDSAEREAVSAARKADAASKAASKAAEKAAQDASKAAEKAALDRANFFKSLISDTASSAGVDVGKLTGTLEGLSTLGLASTGAVVLGVAAIGAAAVVAAVDLAHLTKELDTQAKTAGTSIETFTSYTTLMDKAGVESEDFSIALLDMGEKFRDAAAGSKEAEQMLSTLGISLDEAKQAYGDVNKMLYLVADGVEKSTDKMAANKAAADLLGGSVGEKLVGHLAAGSKGLAEFRNEAREMGLVLDQAAAAESLEAAKAMSELSLAVEGLYRKFSQLATPAVTAFSKAAATFVNDTAKVMNALAPDNYLSNLVTLRTEIATLDKDVAKLAMSSDVTNRASVNKELAALGERRRVLVAQLEDLQGKVNTKPSGIPVVTIASSKPTQAASKPTATKEDSAPNGAKNIAQVKRDAEDATARLLELATALQSATLSGEDAIIAAGNAEIAKINEIYAASDKSAGAQKAWQEATEASLSATSQKLDDYYANIKSGEAKAKSDRKAAIDAWSAAVASATGQSLTAEQQVQADLAETIRLLREKAEAAKAAGADGGTVDAQTEGAIVAATKEASDKVVKIKEEEFQKKADIAGQYLDAAGQIEGAITDALQAEMDRRLQAQQDMLDKATDARIKSEQAVSDASEALRGAQTQEEYQALAERLRAAEAANAQAVQAEQRKQAEMEKLEKEQGKKRKRIALLDAGMNIASAIVRAMADFAPPPSPLGIAAIASAGVIGAAQIATIAKTQYHTGGLVSYGAEVAGQQSAVSKGEVVAKLKPGEFVMNQQATQRIGVNTLDRANKGLTGGNERINLTVDGRALRLSSSIRTMVRRKG